MKNNYREIDLTLAEVKRVRNLFIKNLTEDSTLDDLLNLYNKQIRKILDEKKAKTIKEVLIFLWIYFGKDISKRLSRKYKISMQEAEILFMDKEYIKSQKKAIKYALRGSKVSSKDVVKAAIAIKVVKRFFQRANVVVDTKATNEVVKLNHKKYTKLGYSKYTFHAEIDNRTTDICRSLNNTEFNVEDFVPGITAPPMHCNCRSWISYHY